MSIDTSEHQLVIAGDPRPQCWSHRRRSTGLQAGRDQEPSLRPAQREDSGRNEKTAQLWYPAARPPYSEYAAGPCVHAAGPCVQGLELMDLCSS